MQDYREFLAETLIPEDLLQKRIAEIGAQISKDYAQDGKLVLVCILRGGVVFLVDLMRHISIPHSIEFMAVSSYGSGGRESDGHVRITLDLYTDIGDKDVLIIEDIIDSGHTLKSVMDLLSARRPRSLNVCALLDKKVRREIEIPLRYSGFEIPNKFVFGYGLDMDDYYRNLNFIGVVDLKKYNTD